MKVNSLGSGKFFGPNNFPWSSWRNWKKQTKIEKTHWHKGLNFEIKKCSSFTGVWGVQLLTKLVIKFWQLEGFSFDIRVTVVQPWKSHGELISNIPYMYFYRIQNHKERRQNIILFPLIMLNRIIWQVVTHSVYNNSDILQFPGTADKKPRRRFSQYVQLTRRAQL